MRIRFASANHANEIFAIFARRKPFARFVTMKKILIIEDEEVLLEVLANKLKKEGYEVSIAKDGEEGLRKFKEEKPALVLLDIIMPKMGGFEVLREAIKDPSLAKIPVIVISNSGQPVEIEEALKLGAKDYLIKAEFSPEEVVQRITENLKAGEVTRKEVESSLPPKAAPRDVGGSGSSHRVLIVEDDKFLRDLIVQKMQKEGFDVLQAIDGEEGVKVVKENPVHLILLDLILPGIDGFEVLKRIKEDPSTASIPVIILSNLGQKEDVERGLRLGAQDYLIKAHFTPGEIIDKIRSILK